MLTHKSTSSLNLSKVKQTSCCFCLFVFVVVVLIQAVVFFFGTSQMSPQGQTKIPDSFGDSCDKWYEHSNKHSSSIQDHAGESTQRSVNIYQTRKFYKLFLYIRTVLSSEKGRQSKWVSASGKTDKLFHFSDLYWKKKIASSLCWARVCPLMRWLFMFIHLWKMND